MIIKKLMFLKNFFLKYDSSFLSGVLEKRLKQGSAIGQVLYFSRKQIVFYLFLFGVFSFFLLKVPFFVQGLWNSLSIEQKTVNHTTLKLISGLLIVIALFYTIKLLESSLLKNFDFIIARVQVAARFLMHPSQRFGYQACKTSHLLLCIFSGFSIFPILALYYCLFEYLHAWVLFPAVVSVLACVLIGYFSSKNSRLKEKTNRSSENDMSFFTLIEKYISLIKTLSFNALLQKKIIGFSGESSNFYQKIFENQFVILAVKYSSVFSIVCMNSGLFLFISNASSVSSFIPVFTISILLSAYTLKFCGLFKYSSGAASVLKLLKYTDSLRKEECVNKFDGHEDKEIDHAVSFQKASFVKENQVIFHHMDHALKVNQVTAIIGSSREDRSNYLNACVGNLHQIGGNTHTPKNFEFLSIHSVIFDGSIRENIVQSHDFDAEYYSEVLRACALDKEIDLLPLKDFTLLCQDSNDFIDSFIRKITIARVVYARAPVTFFDDPFASLSVADTSQIFCAAIQKLLQGRTRIFTTKMIEIASLSDEILVFKAGKIIEQNTHIALLSYDSLYSRFFYAGAESSRYEILQNHEKYNLTKALSPLKKSIELNDEPEHPHNSFLLGERVFEKIKKKISHFSHFMKVFFPIFVSKDFYAFFAFLTVSVWAALYSFYFIFSNLNLNIIAKTSLLFFSFNLIACVAFSVMLIFYRKIYATSAYIIENISKIYFANLITIKGKSYRDWKNDHILAVTGHFFTYLLSFFLLGFFSVGLIVFLSGLSEKILIFGAIGVIFGILLAHSLIKNQFLFDEINSTRLNEQLKKITDYFFKAYEETQSDNVRTHLLEKTHAKLYGLYCGDGIEFQKKPLFSDVFGFQALWLNYRIITEMIVKFKEEGNAYKVKPLSYLWPSVGAISLENVKFDSDSEPSNTFDIPIKSRFLFQNDKLSSQKSSFIEKIRAYSSIHSGIIKIDNEDISQISPDIVLRRIGYISRLSYVPFFSIQENIDPYGLCDDAEIWNILTKVGLAQQIALLKHGIATKLDNIPEEIRWSGEIVLLSFARCLVNQNKIICIDQIEASAHVEDKILNLINSELSDSTIIFLTDNEKFKSVCNIGYPFYLPNGEKVVNVNENNAQESWVPGS